jgi:hydrogenase maturation protease
MALSNYLRPSKTLIVGIGSPHGDDQIGWAVVQRLADRLPPGARAQVVRQPAELLDGLNDVELLVVCDACHSGGAVEPGTLSRWTWPTEALVVPRRSGSHDFSLPYVLMLAQRLGKLPPRVVVWGIELGVVGPNQLPRRDLLSALPAIVQTILEDLTGTAKRGRESFSE